jgi:hypothetical protein
VIIISSFKLIKIKSFMRNASLRYLAIIFSFAILFSCKKNDPTPCSTAWALDLQNELTAIGTAASIYFEDQSEANCNALKDAYEDYIDALRPYGNCSTLTGQDRTDWQQALDEAEDDLDSIC